MILMLLQKGIRGVFIVAKEAINILQKRYTQKIKLYVNLRWVKEVYIRVSLNKKCEYKNYSNNEFPSIRMVCMI